MVERIKKIKTFKGWKTIGFNVGAISPFALEALGYALGFPGLQNLVPMEYTNEYILGMGVVNLALRYVTDSAVGSKY